MHRPRKQFPPSSQRRPRKPSVQGRSIASINKKSRHAIAVLAVMCRYAGEKSGLWAYISRGKIAMGCGVRGKSLRFVSDATNALHDAGWIEKSNQRISVNGDVKELLSFKLLPGGHVMLPIQSFGERLGGAVSVNAPQWKLERLNAANPRSLPVWAALCVLAVRRRSMTLDVSKREIADQAGYADKSLEGTGKALQALHDAGWLKIHRRAGRRGNNVVLGRYELIIGAETQYVAPVGALPEFLDLPDTRSDKVPSAEGRVEETPIPDQNAHELLRSNQTDQLHTATDKKEATDAANIGRVRVHSFPSVRDGHLVQPTTQVEMFRPRILDINHLSAIVTLERSALRTYLDNTLRTLDGVVKQGRDKVEQIQQLEDTSHPFHRSYASMRSRWNDLKHWYCEFVEETELNVKILTLVSAALTQSMPPKEIADKAIELNQATQLRSLLRRRRITYLLAPVTLQAIHDGAHDFDRVKQILKNDPWALSASSQLDLGEDPTHKIPKYTPRYHAPTDEGWVWDSAIKGHVLKLPEGHLVSDIGHYSAYRLEERFIKGALIRMARIEKRALQTVERLIGYRLPMDIGDDDDYCLYCFMRDFLEPEGEPSAFLIASIAKCNIADMKENLEPHSELFRTYLKARREYQEVLILGMIVTSRKGLWIVHDDTALPDRAGGCRYSTYAPSIDRTLFFEPFKTYVKAAVTHYPEWNQTLSDDIQ